MIENCERKHSFPFEVTKKKSSPSPDLNQALIDMAELVQSISEKNLQLEHEKDVLEAQLEFLRKWRKS